MLSHDFTITTRFSAVGFPSVNINAGYDRSWCFIREGGHLIRFESSNILRDRWMRRQRHSYKFGNIKRNRKKIFPQRHELVNLWTNAYEIPRDPFISINYQRTHSKRISLLTLNIFAYECTASTSHKTVRYNSLFDFTYIIHIVVGCKRKNFSQTMP